MAARKKGILGRAVQKVRVGVKKAVRGLTKPKHVSSHWGQTSDVRRALVGKSAKSRTGMAVQHARIGVKKAVRGAKKLVGKLTGRKKK